MHIFQMVSTYHPLQIKVKPEQAGQRLDRFLTQEMQGYSRSQVQTLITQGLVSWQSHVLRKSGYCVLPDQIITAQVPSIDLSAMRDIKTDQARSLPIFLIAEQVDFLVVNKPAGITVHPVSHMPEEVTLSDWAIAHYPEIASVGDPARPGIVHRLDKDTSGLLVIARTSAAYDSFAALFASRQIAKEYTCVVQGLPEPAGSINLPITRHPTDRIKMTARAGYGRESLTEYQVIHYGTDHALVLARPHTGRTHQIRVHLAAHGHPLAGDALYGGSTRLIDRQALHASRLAFTYQDQHYDLTCPLPQDIQALIGNLGL